MPHPVIRVAAAHVAPVFLDAAATIDKACSLIAEAARHGAQLIAFPETYVPAFPVWAGVQAPMLNHAFFRRLAENALEINGPEIARVCATARQHGIFVSLGFNEGTRASVGCIWNSNVLISDRGVILNHHRKLVPTFYEKLVWANGDGAGLRVSETPLGRIGMLICGENTNPLARYTLMAQGEQLHIASYPPVWPTRPPANSGNYDLRHAIRIRAAAHAFEAKCFNLVVSGYMDRAMLDALDGLEKNAREALERSPRGVSLVVDPTGESVSEEFSADEGLLYAELDLGACVEPKQFHDVVGQYNRFDVFHLKVDRRRLQPIEFIDHGVNEIAAGSPFGSHAFVSAQGDQNAGSGGERE